MAFLVKQPPEEYLSSKLINLDGENSECLARQNTSRKYASKCLLPSAVFQDDLSP